MNKSATEKGIFLNLAVEKIYVLFKKERNSTISRSFPDIVSYITWGHVITKQLRDLFTSISASIENKVLSTATNAKISY